VTADGGDRERDDRGRAQNARPRDVLGRPLPRGAAGVPRVPEDLDLPPAAALVEAQRLLDAGMPFHAHEVLEAVWKAAPAAERDLWQGLAQLAVGLTHHLRGNAAGAGVLLRRGRGRVAPWARGGDRAGTGSAVLVDVDGLLAWSEPLLAVVDAAAAGAPAVPDEPPRTPRLRRRAPGRTDGTDGTGATAPAVRLGRRALTRGEAEEVLAWRYPPPHDRHDLPAAAAGPLVHRSPDGREGYEPVLDADGHLVAVLCLGPEATVAGQPHRAAGAAAPEEEDVLDVGLGVRPDLLGRGVGSRGMAALVAALRAEASPPSALRAVAREDDARALAVLAGAGLTARARFVGRTATGEATFTELRGRLAGPAEPRA